MGGVQSHTASADKLHLVVVEKGELARLGVDGAERFLDAEVVYQGTHGQFGYNVYAKIITSLVMMLMGGLVRSKNNMEY